MIPEDRLTAWSNQGGTTNSIAAHTSIRNALFANDSGLNRPDFEIYLQGSYKNSTNIRADSDVDLVVQYNKVYYRDLARLSPPEVQRYEGSHHTVEYDAVKWRGDVEKALRKKFPGKVQLGGGKAFKVVTGPGDMTADILPAFLYKQYTHYNSLNDEGFDPGVKFADSAGKITLNYPKLHIENGEAKNSEFQTDGRYKPSVRMFKNARNTATERGLLVDGAAPSYFVECLLYNVLDECFTASVSDTYAAVVNHLSANAIDGYYCQNGQLPLFGPDSTQWNTIDATAFVQALVDLWNAWV
jgi:predicted nucleotidyltransferase